VEEGSLASRLKTDVRKNSPPSPSCEVGERRIECTVRPRAWALEYYQRIAPTRRHRSRLLLTLLLLLLLLLLLIQLLLLLLLLLMQVLLLHMILVLLMLHELLLLHLR
jgi:hypothetical protein